MKQKILEWEINLGITIRVDMPRQKGQQKKKSSISSKSCFNFIKGNYQNQNFTTKHYRQERLY